MIEIKVPATTANIGPGFDTLGIALSLYDVFEVSRSSHWAVEGCDPMYRGEDNLFLQSYRNVQRLLGEAARPVHVNIRAGIPVARGLGSSAALCVGGAAAALLLAGGNGAASVARGRMCSGEVPRSGERVFFDQETQGFLEDAASALEGHPDNAVPAVRGGFCAAFRSETLGGQNPGAIGSGATPNAVPYADSGAIGSGSADPLRAAAENSSAGFHTVASRSRVAASWRFHALIPPFELETKNARAILPASISRADAVFNIGRAVLVSQAIAAADADLLGAACDDRIHQPYRQSLIAGYQELKAACASAGARAFWLSGSGPTLMALTVGPAQTREFSDSIESFLRDFHYAGPVAAGKRTWTHRCLRPDNKGVWYVVHPD